MTFMRLLIIGAAVLLIALEPAGSFGQGLADESRTLSPYLYVAGADGEIEALPLRSTDVEVNIAGVIADVTIRQSYQNRGDVPLEAVYLFPGSTRAAVYAMKMTVGERVRRAVIRERKIAQAQYSQAKKEGKSASLLEQHRPNVFQMKVANIMPGDAVVIELAYTELLIPTDGVYEFVYPTVVGPRYSNQLAAAADDNERWVANPYLRAGTEHETKFNLTATLNAGMNIQDIISPSHDVTVSFTGRDRATISLKESQLFTGDRDYILRYRLQGARIESGLLLYEGPEENFFLLMVQAPHRVPEAFMPPREYIFVVDVSGSMYGFPLEISKRLMNELLPDLRPQDTFNILLFSGASALLAERSLPATSANIQRARTLIDSQIGGGGTELLPALQRALGLPMQEQNSRTIVVITDGYVSIEAEAFDLIRSNLGRANVFTFGIGSSVNRHLIEGLARVGTGEAFVATDAAAAVKTAERFRSYISKPALTGIQMDFGKLGAYDVEPTNLPDLFEQKPLIINGKWRGNREGAITISGTTGAEDYQSSIALQEIHPHQRNSALQYLWARHRIASLGDYQQLEPSNNRIQQITELGLRYSLLSRYTSFIAIDESIRNTVADTHTVKQPLPLPHGVSEYAVGSTVPGTPEPAIWMMLGVLGLLFILVLKKRQKDLCLVSARKR